MKKGIFLFTILILLASCQKRYDLSTLDNPPKNGEELRTVINEIIAQNSGNKIKIIIPKGVYKFNPEMAVEREYYISGHDQSNPRKVGLVFENKKNLVIDGQGSTLIFDGQMLPISLVNTEECQLKNLNIDFQNPRLSQIKIIQNDTLSQTITFEIAPWVKYEIKDSTLYTTGNGWRLRPKRGVAFDGQTKQMVYQSGDFTINNSSITEISPRVLRSYGWKNNLLTSGTIVILIDGTRPSPGIFISDSKKTEIENVSVHYADGIGILAQSSESISLNKFSVCLRGEDDPRYFTTVADAVNFSGCKGIITVKNGLFENMMDDAINVHGTYLKITERVDAYTINARYMHPQTFGFEWGNQGDEVQIINANTMEIIGEKNLMLSIIPLDRPTTHGAKEFQIRLKKPLHPNIDEKISFAIENLTWTPKVIFSNNTIRNNRARGALFSTPKKTLVENNLFDHISGSAILICGECDRWFETGACHHVVIRKNTFINSLTCNYQFSNAIISINPVISNLNEQKSYFHHGILIENNLFETFDNPIVYAKSVNGIILKNNLIRKNNLYPPFHWNDKTFKFERVTNQQIANNRIEISCTKTQTTHKNNNHEKHSHPYSIGACNYTSQTIGKR